MRRKRVQRKTITQPPSYWQQWERAAARQGQGLSEWIADCCNQKLPGIVRRRLPTRPTKGQH